MRRLIAVMALLLLAPATSASAAEPDKGSVSSASPKVAWKGTLIRPYAYHLIFNTETPGTFACSPPGCDTFTLDVAEEAPLTISVVSEKTEDMSLRIKNPAGEWSYHAGWGDGQKPTNVKIKKAQKGTYVVNIVARIFGTGNPTAVDDTADYAGTAALTVAAPAPAPVVTLPPAPAEPAPAPAEPKPAAAKKPSKKKAACQKKARKTKNAKKRKAALKKCRRK